MKKISTFILAAALALSLVGCGAKTSGGNSGMEQNGSSLTESGQAEPEVVWKDIDWEVMSFSVPEDWKEDGELTLKNGDLALMGMINQDETANMTKIDIYVESLEKALTDGNGAVIDNQRSETYHGIEYGAFDYVSHEGKIFGKMYVTIWNRAVIALSFQNVGAFSEEQLALTATILESVALKGAPIPDDFVKIDWGSVVFYAPSDWSESGYHELQSANSALSFELLECKNDEKYREEFASGMKEGFTNSGNLKITNETTAIYQGINYGIWDFTYSELGSGRLYFSFQDNAVFNFTYIKRGDMTAEDEALLDSVIKTVRYNPEEAKEALENDGLITKAAFDRIQTGMTYAQVVEIAGSPGELLSKSDLGMGSAYVTEIYAWYGKGMVGANCNIMFQGGKVISKTQIGLQ